MAANLIFPSPPNLASSVKDSPEEVRAYLEDLWQYLENLRARLGAVVPFFVVGSATYDPPNLADGAGTTTTVPVTGAALGDLAFASFSLDLQGITVTAYVSAAAVVSVRFQNESGGAVDLASGTLTAWAMRPPNAL